MSRSGVLRKIVMRDPDVVWALSNEDYWTVFFADAEGVECPINVPMVKYLITNRNHVPPVGERKSEYEYIWLSPSCEQCKPKFGKPEYSSVDEWGGEACPLVRNDADRKWACGRRSVAYRKMACEE